MSNFSTRKTDPLRPSRRRFEKLRASHAAAEARKALGPQVACCNLCRQWFPSFEARNAHKVTSHPGPLAQFREAVALVSAMRETLRASAEAA